METLNPRPSSKAVIAKVNYTHDAMIDMLISNPRITQGELAAHFGYRQAWVSMVMSSDAFRERLAQRREELVDPSLRLGLEERFRAMTTRSLEVLQEKLEVPAHQVPDNLVLKAIELGAKGLGLGGNAPPQAPRESEGDRLDRLAGRLLALQSTIRGSGGAVYESKAREVSEGDYIPVPSQQG